MRLAALSLAAAGLLLGAACDRLALGPPTAEPAPVAAPAAIADFRPFAGRTYADLVAAHPSYTADAQHLSPPELARFNAAMVTQQPAWLISGGGAEVLVFAGCAADGCAAGRAILAVDVATGEALMGLRDGQGSSEFVQNERVEALLRLNAPTRQWADVQNAAPTQAAP